MVSFKSAATKLLALLVAVMVWLQGVAAKDATGVKQVSHSV
jgi:hypothetical protein